VLDDEDRIARHYYDVHCCLGHASTLQDLRDTVRMQITFADVERISRDRYGAIHPRPDSGYGSSPAFQPGTWNDVRGSLEAAYARAMQLMRIEARDAGAWPSLGQVLQRVEEHASFL
jgi:hypothetical protein